jgi:hypothetical protein
MQAVDEEEGKERREGKGGNGSRVQSPTGTMMAIRHTLLTLAFRV